MSRNLEDADKKEDQRVRRTRDRLGDALVDLFVEKPFDNITVQDVLDRAGVSRSTFYTHYRDKNDLFLSDAEDFFEAMATALSRFGDKSERVAPVRELFAHIAEVRPFYDALVESGRMHDVMELGQGHFARGIEQRLNEMPRARAIPPDRRGAIAHGLAGSLFSLLTWWVQHGMTSPPEEMDKLFHRLVWNGADGPT
ncbi:MAG TPA: TetR/AcrR family transcriptional regulator [Chthoniobacterales bacterium]|nr:TetR/AcrR family transcriptional regulator [Chthoniobacterales bacterium]